jgi:hypothetical protein
VPSIAEPGAGEPFSRQLVLGDVMSILSASATPEAASREEFLDVLLADEDLLRAEFDAIIADAWPDAPHAAPPPTPCRRRAASPRGSPSRAPERPSPPAWARQRSPPPCPAGTHRKR